MHHIHLCCHARMLSLRVLCTLGFKVRRCLPRTANPACSCICDSLSFFSRLASVDVAPFMLLATPFALLLCTASPKPSMMSHAGSLLLSVLIMPFGSAVFTETIGMHPLPVLCFTKCCCQQLSRAHPYNSCIIIIQLVSPSSAQC